MVKTPLRCDLPYGVVVTAGNLRKDELNASEGQQP